MSEFSWLNVPIACPDPILGLNDAYNGDTYPKKINVGIGAYRDDNGLPVVLNSVKKAEKDYLAREYPYKEYAPVSGLPEFCKLSKKLVYGEDLPLDNIAIVQTISGSGALSLGASFLHKYLHSSNLNVLIPTPTWGNHQSIFAHCGFICREYPYYNSNALSLDIDGMLKAIQDTESGNVILLHACAHNPTGIDPSTDQWKLIHQAIKEKKLVTFFDLAYQGFATGNLDEDASAVRLFVLDPPGPVLVAQSYAKNMGMYGERIGSFSILCSSETQREAVISQLRILIRASYSSPPIHGARLVSIILGNQELKNEWISELKEMTGRIKQMRISLRSALEKKIPNSVWKHITNQIGMFCYTGLSTEQVSKLVRDYHIYMTSDGRISLAGVNNLNIDTLADAISQVVLEN